MKKPILITILAASLCLPALAEVDHRVKADREKESRRCMERSKNLVNMEEFEKKFGWSKEHFGNQRHKLLEKRKAASRAWKEAGEKIKHAQNHDQIDALKIAAYQAGAEAYLAELELRADGAEKRWMGTAEKVGTEAAKKAARDLVENQRLVMEVTKSKMLSEHHLRGLAWQKHEHENILNGEYRKAREKEEQARNKGRKPSNTNGRPIRKPDPKPAAKPEPPKIRIE